MTEKVAGTSAVAEKADSPAQAAPEKRRALGRGLDSLLPSGPRMVPNNTAAPVPGVIPELQAQAARAEAGDEITKIKLDQIDENPYQTRVTFEPAALQELAESIRVNGVVQPIVVRLSSMGRFVLILGERRCRAAKLAGETTKLPWRWRQLRDFAGR